MIENRTARQVDFSFDCISILLMWQLINAKSKRTRNSRKFPPKYSSRIYVLGVP